LGNTNSSISAGSEPEAGLSDNTIHWNKVFLNFDKVNVKVKFTLEQATKAQRGSRGIALLFP
jgi:hypothetical protein